MFQARLQSLEAAVASIDDVAHQKSLKSEEQVDIGPGNSGNGNHMSLGSWICFLVLIFFRRDVGSAFPFSFSLHFFLFRIVGIDFQGAL